MWHKQPLTTKLKKVESIDKCIPLKERGSEGGGEQGEKEEGKE